MLIEVSTYKDIDAFLKPTIDGIALKLGFSDSNILSLQVKKKKQKKGAPESIDVYIGALNDCE